MKQWLFFSTLIAISTQLSAQQVNQPLFGDAGARAKIARVGATAMTYDVTGDTYSDQRCGDLIIGPDAIEAKQRGDDDNPILDGLPPFEVEDGPEGITIYTPGIEKICVQ